MVGHYDGGRNREALRELAFVGNCSKLGATKFLYETPGRGRGTRYWFGIVYHGSVMVDAVGK